MNSTAMITYPQEMLEAPRWLLHRDKVPYYTTGSPRGKTDTARDIARLVPYEVAAKALADSNGHYTGLSFALGGGFWGVDLDKVIAEDGTVVSWAKKLLVLARKANNYIEVSLSGRGYHIIGLGELGMPSFRASALQIEAYDGGRHFTMTGRGKALTKPQGLISVEFRAELVARLGDKAPKPAAPVPAPLKRSPSEWAFQRNEAGPLLQELDPDMPYPEWISVGMALHHASGGAQEALDLWTQWSECGTKYQPGEPARMWASFNHDAERPVTFATLVAMGRKAQSARVFAAKAVEEAKAPKRTADGLPKRFALSDLDDMVVPQTQWLVEGLLARGLTLLVGAPKSGKSYLALQLCIAVASGRPFLDRQTRKVKTAYYDLEEWHELLDKRRKPIMAAMGVTGADVRGYLDIAMEVPAGDAALDYIREDIAAGCGLIVVDIFARIRDELSENSRANAYARDMAVLGRIADLVLEHPDVALVVVHHTNKGQHDDWQNRISGSTGVTGASHCNILLAKPDMRGWSAEDKEAGQWMRTLHAVGKQVEEQEMVLERMDHGGGWRPAAIRPHEISTTRKQKQILLMLHARYPAFVPSKEVAEAHGMKPGAAKQLLYRMAQQGVIESSGSGGDGYRAKK